MKLKHFFYMQYVQIEVYRKQKKNLLTKRIGMKCILQSHQK